MDYQEIRYGPAEGAGPQVVQVTLDRPAALNAYTSRMCEELNDALLRYARDDDARVLVLTGAGRAFCAGGDVASQVEVEEAGRRQAGCACRSGNSGHRCLRRTAAQCRCRRQARYVVGLHRYRGARL